MEERLIGKVAALVIRNGIAGAELLVFDHPLAEGGINIQLPAGTIDPHEEPEEAVVRELWEEAGVHGRIIGLAGVTDEEWQGEKRRRWVYLLSASDRLPEEWPSTCDCGVATLCHWVPFESAEIVWMQQPWLEMAREWVSTLS